MAESSPIDIPNGIQVFGSEEKFNSNLQNYPKAILQNLNDLNEGFKNKSQDKIRKSAHNFKGSSSYAAATKIQNLCFALQLLNEPENQFQFELSLRIHQDIAKESDSAFQFISNKFNMGQDAAINDAVQAALSIANENALPPDYNAEEIISKYKR